MKPSSQSTGSSKTYKGPYSSQDLIKTIAFGTFISLVIIPLPSFADGPSYDCAEAKSEVETTICENPDLAQAELTYTNAFSETKLLLDDAVKKDLARILLDRRNICLSDKNCLSAVLNYGTGFWQGTAEVRITDGLISDQKSLNDTRVAFNRLSEIARKDIQTQLKSDNFYDGKIDGEYGIATWKALKVFGKATGREQSPIDALNLIVDPAEFNDGNECNGCEPSLIEHTSENTNLTDELDDPLLIAIPKFIYESCKIPHCLEENYAAILSRQLIKNLEKSGKYKVITDNTSFKDFTIDSFETHPSADSWKARKVQAFVLAEIRTDGGQISSIDFMLYDPLTASKIPDFLNGKDAVSFIASQENLTASKMSEHIEAMLSALEDYRTAVKKQTEEERMAAEKQKEEENATEIERAKLLNDEPSERFVKSASFVLSGGSTEDLRKSDDDTVNIAQFRACTAVLDIDIVLLFYQVRMEAWYNFNKVNWKSATIQTDGSSQTIAYSGEQGMIEYHLPINATDSDQQIFTQALTLGVFERKPNQASHPLIVTKERYIAALQDLTAECPGIQSTY